MPLRLLIDEDTQAALLVKLMRNAGHDVITVNEANLTGQPDFVVLDSAKTLDRLLLTLNCDDFEELHILNSNHPGIFVVYQDADRTKNMTFKDIVRSIANIEAAQIPLANQFIVLNQWNY